MLQHLTIVATGGTIDKIYFDDKSTFQIGSPQIGEILNQLGVAFAFDVIALMRKDSLHMDDADRDLIRRTIAEQPHRHVLVTHGTDTMVETARVLTGIAGKVIVLTGSLNPARFQGSDAVFNIGGANIRQVTGRQAPSVMNSVYNYRSFWDGRGRETFNGVNPFGATPAAGKPQVLQVGTNGLLSLVSLSLNNGSAASQAVGPATNPNSQ